MQHTKDLDLLHPLRVSVDYNPRSLLDDSPIADHVSRSFELEFFQNRERIDSEDFMISFSGREFLEADLFPKDCEMNRLNVADEKMARRKSSMMVVSDPTLLELEVD
jgi:hypothetical protein